MQTYIAITGRRLTPAYLSLDYNPPYDVAFITLKYAHCERGAYDLRAYTQPSVRSSRKEGRKGGKKLVKKRDCPANQPLPASPTPLPLPKKLTNREVEGKRGGRGEGVDPGQGASTTGFFLVQEPGRGTA